MQKFELRQQFSIESARFLPRLPESHPCSRMHGHSFKITLVIRGGLTEVGWVRDYHEISKAVMPILALVDHRVLNEVEGLENPTSELLCVWLFNKIRVVIPELHQVIVAETPTTECAWPV